MEGENGTDIQQLLFAFLETVIHRCGEKNHKRSNKTLAARTEYVLQYTRKEGGANEGKRGGNRHSQWHHERLGLEISRKIIHAYSERKGRLIMKYTYTAVFTPEENGRFSVNFPDLQGCYTSGDDMADAVYMAQDVQTSTSPAFCKRR